MLQALLHWFGKRVWRTVWSWLRRIGLARARERAACVPARVSQTGALEVMLIESQKKPGTYVFPGGGIDAGESAEVAALRELYEEAGVSGHGLAWLGEFLDSSSNSRTSIFLVTVDAEHETWPEGRLGRIRRWFALADLDRNLSSKALHRHTLALVLARRLTASELE